MEKYITRKQIVEKQTAICDLFGMGTLEPVVATFRNGLVYYNDNEKPFGLEEFINEILAPLCANYFTSVSTHYTNGNWATERKTSEKYEQIINMTEQDYLASIKVFNLLTLAKTFAIECDKKENEDKLYHLFYNFEEDFLDYDLTDSWLNEPLE